MSNVRSFFVMTILPTLLLLMWALFPIKAKAEVEVTPPVQISGTPHNVLERPNKYRFQISPNDQYVVYVASIGESDKLHLFSVPIEGGDVIQLTPTSIDLVFDFKISPDSNWVIYRGNNGLHSVPVIGGENIRLDLARPVSSSIASVEFTPDSQNIVYHDFGALWSIGIDGSNATLLNANQPAEVAFDVGGFTLSPDSSTVVFALTEIDNTQHLYSVPVGQSNLIDLIADTSNVESFLRKNYTEDGSRIIYSIYTISGFYTATFSIPSTGGVPVSLSPVPTGEGGSSTFIFNNDDSRIIYGFGDTYSSIDKIISADVITGHTSVLVNSPGTIGQYSVSSFEDKVLYSIRDGVSENYKFFSISANGVGGALSLLDGLAIGPAQNNFTLSPDEKNFIWSNTESLASGFKHDLQVASIDTSTVSLLNSTTDNREFGFNRDFRVGSDSSRVVFENDDFDDSSYGIFVVPISGKTVTRITSSDLLNEFYDISGDGEYVVFSAIDQDDPDRIFKIYSAKLETLNTASNDDFCFVIKEKSGSVVTLCL